MVSVRCMVEECTHNAGLYCEAQKIRVRSSGCKHVNNPDSTACETFACRDAHSSSL